MFNDLQRLLDGLFVTLPGLFTPGPRMWIGAGLVCGLAALLWFLFRHNGRDWPWWLLGLGYLMLAFWPISMLHDGGGWVERYRTSIVVLMVLLIVAGLTVIAVDVMHSRRKRAQV